jgi:hypothetical protein
MRKSKRKEHEKKTSDHKIKKNHGNKLDKGKKRNKK